jgi:hypothetical protein
MAGARDIAEHLARLWSGYHSPDRSVACVDVGHDWLRRCTVVQAGCPAVEEWRCTRCGSLSVDTQNSDSA